jgi:hypothetical protein
MNLRRSSREKLKELSMQVYGRSSKWRHVLEDGVMVWNEADGRRFKVWKPVSLLTLVRTMKKVIKAKEQANETTQTAELLGDDEIPNVS